MSTGRPRGSPPYRSGAPSVTELAAGVAVRRATDRRLLLLHFTREDRWCFPKGHVEPGESLEIAALRELAEETGLRDVTLGPEVAELHYRFYRRRRRVNALKTTVYFIGSSSGGEPLRLEPIFDRAEWVSMAEARRRLPYPDEQAVLRGIESAVRRAPLTRSRKEGGRG